jgi:hypothetical protein
MSAPSPPGRPELSLQAALLLDSVRHCPGEQLLVPVSECLHGDVCSELHISIRNQHVRALELSFFSSLSQVDSPLHLFLSKVINQKCQVRMFEEVMKSKLSDPNHPTLAKQVQELVLCSLLGNYSASDPASRPVTAVRDVLYDLLRPVFKPAPWLLLLLNHCRVVVLFCLREAVVFAVDDQPAVERQLNEFVHFQQFRSIVTSAMAVLRRHVAVMLQTPGSSLYAASVLGEESTANSRWVTEIQFLMQPYSAALLKIIYRRPKQSFRQFLLALSNSKQAATSGPVIPRLVSVPEIQALRQLAERLVHWRFGVLPEMVRWLVHFNVSSAMVRLFCVVLELYCKGGPPKELQTALLAAEQVDPRAFQLLRIITVVVQEVHKVKPVGRLPLNCIEAQLDACQARFGMKSNNPDDPAGAVLAHLLTFVYCDVCFTTYSFVADETSVFKQDYLYGTRGAVVDLQTGQFYCNGNKHTHRGSCQTKPLRQILLLGNVLKVNGSLIALCGQPKCGRPMVMSPNSVANLRGLSCCFCSQRLQAPILSVRELIAYYQETTGGYRHCLYCSVELTSTNEVHVYPMRSYLCRKHHSADLAAHVVELRKAQADYEMTDADKRTEMERSMVEFIDIKQEERLKRLAKSAAGRVKRMAKLMAALK